MKAKTKVYQTRIYYILFFLIISLYIPWLCDSVNAAPIVWDFSTIEPVLTKTEAWEDDQFGSASIINDNATFGDISRYLWFLIIFSIIWFVIGLFVYDRKVMKADT